MGIMVAEPISLSLSRESVTIEDEGQEEKTDPRKKEPGKVVENTRRTSPNEERRTKRAEEGDKEDEGDVETRKRTAVVDGEWKRGSEKLKEIMARMERRKTRSDQDAKDVQAHRLMRIQRLDREEGAEEGRREVREARADTPARVRRPSSSQESDIGDENKPDKFRGEERKFRCWKERFLEYVDKKKPGMEEILEHIAGNVREACDLRAREHNKYWREKMINRVTAIKLWIWLRRCTGGEVRRKVEKGEEVDGFLAWREVVRQYDNCAGNKMTTRKEEGDGRREESKKKEERMEKPKTEGGDTVEGGKGSWGQWSWWNVKGKGKGKGPKKGCFVCGGDHFQWDCMQWKERMEVDWGKARNSNSKGGHHSAYKASEESLQGEGARYRRERSTAGASSSGGIRVDWDRRLGRMSSEEKVERRKTQLRPKRGREGEESTEGETEEEGRMRKVMDFRRQDRSL